MECVANEIAESFPIIMTIIDNTIPSISILANVTEICEGDMVTFIATPVNGGTDAAYQWRKNGAVISTGSLVYYAEGLEDGDIISCVLMSSEACSLLDNVASNSIEISVENCTVSNKDIIEDITINTCLLYTSPSPRDATLSRMPSSA